ncbi:MAG: type II toxin-antitoxin system RelE/ParE family toxin [Candidatus Sumerlaeota bacterium]|nr:type II toxin-antitoxin system RelE/ParE family toxin [Candidatus Sumerlaeota bacterium]
MDYSLSLLPEVEEDAIAAYGWYEGKAIGLGDEFLRVFYATAAKIARAPFLYRKVHRDFRRCLVKRFPYAIYYLVEKDEVIVYGLFHCARDPQFILDTIDDRRS